LQKNPQKTVIKKMSSLEPANQQVAQHYHCISTMCYPPEYGSSNDQNAKIL